MNIWVWRTILQIAEYVLLYESHYTPFRLYIQGMFSMCHWYIPEDQMIYQIASFRTVGDLLWNFATLSVSRSAIISDMTLTWTHINFYAFNDACNAMGSIIFIWGSTTLSYWQNILQAGVKISTTLYHIHLLSVSMHKPLHIPRIWNLFAFIIHNINTSTIYIFDTLYANAYTCHKSC